MSTQDDWDVSEAATSFHNMQNLEFSLSEQLHHEAITAAAMHHTFSSTYFSHIIIIIHSSRQYTYDDLTVPP